jgi:hypothetical protein
MRAGGEGPSAGDPVGPPEKRPTRPRRPLLFRLTRALVVAVLAVTVFCAVVYAVAMNVFLSTSLFARVIDGQPDVIDIHFDRGWSVVPGHIHAKNLSIRGRDGDIEWILRLDSVEFDVAFHALAQQRFEASHVYGRGISFRLRQRLDAPPRSLDEVANLPPIEGTGPYAVHPPPGPDLQKWSDAAYHLWTGHLEDVVASDVREVWIDNAHFVGSAKITGRFYFKPVRLADVGPIHIDVREGHVQTGDTIVVDRLAGASADVRVFPFDPRTAHGMDLVRHVMLSATLHPTCPDIARLPLPMPDGMAMTGEADVSQLALVVREAALQEGTRVDATLPHAIVTRGEHRFTGAVALAGGVTGGDVLGPVPGRLDLLGRVTDLDVARTSDSSAPVGVFLHVPRTTVAGDSRTLDLDALLTDMHLVVDVAGGVLPDVAALSAYVPEGTPLALTGGTGRVNAHLETWRTDKRAAGSANLHVDDLGLRLGKMRVRGTASADASFGTFPWATSRMQNVKLALHVKSGALASEQNPLVPLVRVFDLRVDTGAEDFELGDPLRNLRAVIVMDSGEIVAPDLLAAYLPKASEMHVLSERARFSLACELALANHRAGGTLDVTSKQLGFSFGDFHVGVDLRARARVHDWQWERGDLALDRADVDITNVSVYRPARVEGAGPGPSPAAGAAPAVPALSFARISLGAKSRHFSFGDPLEEVDLTAALVDAKVHDSSVVNAFLPSGAPFLFRADEGGFSSDIEAEVRDHVLRGTIALRAKNMGIGGKSLHIEGDADVAARVSSWDFAANTVGVDDAHVVLSRVTGGFHGAPADASIPALASANALDKPDFRAETVELWAATPTLDLVKPTLQNVDGRVTIVGAELPDATVLQSFVPAGSIVGVEFGGARVAGNLEVSSTRHTAHGRLEVELPQTGIRFHETHLAGNFKVSALLLGYDPDRKVFDVSGSSVAMHDVQVTNASTDTSRWQGDAVFKDATLRLDPDPELDGKVTVEARDASPILAILLGNGLPKIFVGLTRMPHLSGAARLTMGSRNVALRDLDAHGGDISIEGLYVVAHDHRAGAFIVGKGPFSAGFALDDKGAHLRLFGLKGWLRDETVTSLRLLDGSRPPSGTAAPQAVSRPVAPPAGISAQGPGDGSPGSTVVAP